ncbi:hypothetical protein QIS74_04516 [Colletotrichum tabaci]|uniref:Glucose-methanol-choline oxidoreductase N-terminal domain-containing protein n=1 Tax=Colletotrichum tabaci TaxID=1209068 RepID=A0AAV9TKS1_9PEZI
MISLKSGGQRVIVPRKEIILCAGAIDTPRLMLLSGLGPKSQLEGLGIDVVKDIPGVGENLQDHPEGIIMRELNRPVPPNQTTMNSDAGIFLRREPTDAAGSDGNVADLMMHCYQAPYSHHTERAGFEFIPDPYVFCMIPNIPRTRSRGRVYLTSAKPAVKPALDFQCFSDLEGYDAAPMTWGIKAAHLMLFSIKPAFLSWLKVHLSQPKMLMAVQRLGAAQEFIKSTKGALPSPPPRIRDVTWSGPELRWTWIIQLTKGCQMIGFWSLF